MVPAWSSYVAEALGVAPDNVQDRTWLIPTTIEPVPKEQAPLPPEPGEAEEPAWKLLPPPGDLSPATDLKSRKKVYNYVCQLYGTLFASTSAE